MSFPQDWFRAGSKGPSLRGLFVALQSGLGDDLRSIRAGGEARYFMAMSGDFTMKSLGISRVVSPSNIGDSTVFFAPRIWIQPDSTDWSIKNWHSTKKEGFHQKVTSWWISSWQPSWSCCSFQSAAKRPDFWSNALGGAVGESFHGWKFHRSWDRTPRILVIHYYRTI